MAARPVVPPGEEPGPGGLEPHAGQLGPERQDRLEVLGRTGGIAETHLDSAEQEKPFDPLRVRSGPCLLEECPCVFQPPGADEEPSRLEVREPGHRHARRIRSGLGARTGRPRLEHNRKAEREQDTGPRPNTGDARHAR